MTAFGQVKKGRLIVLALSALLGLVGPLVVWMIVSKKKLRDLTGQKVFSIWWLLFLPAIPFWWYMFCKKLLLAKSNRQYVIFLFSLVTMCLNCGLFIFVMPANMPLEVVIGVLCFFCVSIIVWGQVIMNELTANPIRRLQPEISPLDQFIMVSQLIITILIAGFVLFLHFGDHLIDLVNGDQTQFPLF